MRVILLTILLQGLIRQVMSACSTRSDCDPRCNGQCSAENDINKCCDCVQSYFGVEYFYWIYKDVGSGARCYSSCQTKYYKENMTTPNECRSCAAECQECTNSTQFTCTTCVDTAYKLNATTCYQIQTSNAVGVNNPCPPPYLGIYTTKKCQPCPTGCAQCGIYLDAQMPGTGFSSTVFANYAWTPACFGDGLCDYAVKCSSCKAGYAFEEGKCFTLSRCRKYSMYNSTASGFNSAYCFCKPGFYLSGLTSCSMCHYTCKTCTGPASNQCSSCIEGHVLDEDDHDCAQKNSTYVILVDWNDGIDNGAWAYIPTPNLATVASGDCTSANYRYGGYYGYDTSANTIFGKAKITYDLLQTDISTASDNHYGFHVKVTILFIDFWPNGIKMNFRAGGIGVHTYVYDMEDIIGEQVCGRSFHDHHEVIQFTFPHTDLAADLDMQIQCTDVGFQWAIKDVVIGLLTCDPTCDECDGPTTQDCTVCLANQMLEDGDCVCDSTAGYYNDTDGVCKTNCSDGYYADDILHKCVEDCDVSTNQFKLQNTTTDMKYCVEHCPDGYWKYTENMTCVDDCFDTTIIVIQDNYYNFNGSDKVCYQECPSGYVADPVSHQCVTTCPNITGNDGYFNLNGFCKRTCDADTYAYYGDQAINLTHFIEINETNNRTLNVVIVDDTIDVNDLISGLDSGVRYEIQIIPIQAKRECVEECPTGYFHNTYEDQNGDTHNICEEECSVSLDGTYQLGSINFQTNYRECVQYCPEDTYADYTIHLCVYICNGTSYRQSLEIDDGAGGTITQRLCVEECDPAGHTKFGNPYTRECVIPTQCPDGFYGDPMTTFCERQCNNISLFGDNFTRLCQQTCSNGAFKQNDTKICVATCPTENQNGEPQYGDPFNFDFYCVKECIGDTFADNQTNRECVQTCASSPSPTFGLYSDGSAGSVNMCVTNCSNQTWADPFHANRICTTSCTLNSFGYNQTRMCVSECPDTQFSIVIDTIPICVYVCQERTTGMYGHVLNNTCVEQCPPPYYGDPTGNRSCVLECPEGYFAQNSTDGTISSVRECVETCDYGWANTELRKCVHTPYDCEDGLFAHETDHKCVNATDCDGYGDVITKQCQAQCYNDADVFYFADPTTKLCVLICPEDPDDLYGDNHTHTCQSACTVGTEVRDPQHLRRCHTECSRQPLALYADFTDGTCVTIKNCSEGFYSDNHTNECESDCQGDILQYRDEVSRQCVATCQMGYWALNTSADQTDLGLCSKTCPVPLWADNLTVRCEPECSDNTYGLNMTDPDNPSNLIGVCVSECPEGQYARDMDHVCIQNCEDHHWGNNDTNFCVISPYDCPNGTYADNQTHMCVESIGCSEVGGIQYVGDNLTQQCLPQCPQMNTTYQNWADFDKNLCVAKCPDGMYGYNETRECQSECRDDNTSPWPDQYADQQLQICVEVCSAYPIPTFGQDVDHTCVEARYCPGETWAEDFVNDRMCVATCPNPNERGGNLQMYADNITKSCVTRCPTHFYGDLQRGYGMCVSQCPRINSSDANYPDEYQFADNYSKTCVRICPEDQNTFGDVVWLACVYTCPDGYFAQEDPVRHCVQVCANETWGDPIRKFCVTSPDDCPTVNGTHFYAHNSSHMCVQTCLPGDNTWGQNSTWTCNYDCETGFKFNDTRVCIDICPPSQGGNGSFSDQGMCYFVCITDDYFRDVQNARSCQPSCSYSPLEYYQDTTTMKCVFECPAYPQPFFAYNITHQCVTDCPGDYIRDFRTRKCVLQCDVDQFYDPNSDHCVEECPHDFSTDLVYYGHADATPYPTCVTAEGCGDASLFADDQLGLCVENCTNNQWKSGDLCVTHCPDGEYGNFDTGFCVIPEDCPDDHYANNQTKTCVDVCYGVFADTDTKICVEICPEGLFADPVTHMCSVNCTNNQNVSLHRDNETRSCVSDCDEYLFLNTLNNTCEESCIDGYYADRTTQVCVEVCPSVPPLFGDNDTNTCVQECDNDTLEYKYIPERVCVSVCPDDWFRDNHTRFCVQQCENVTYADDISGYCVTNCTPRYSFDDPNVCLDQCPAPFYRDPTTFKCVDECPHYPVRYFRVVEGLQRYCDTDCPGGQYRDHFSHSCVSYCPPSPPTFADDSTGDCVAVCPTMYADAEDRKCKARCPDGMYAENTTRKCVYMCPNGTDTYGDRTYQMNVDGSPMVVPFCVHLCPEFTFADPYTLKCESVCTGYPKLYGFDNGTHRICLQSCPYPYVEDDTYSQCRLYCMGTDLPYLDKGSKSCVSSCQTLVYRFSYMPDDQDVNGTCVDFCPGGRFALLTNFSCVPKCPDGQYGDIQNNTCYSNCSLANDKFADPYDNMCRETCTYNSDYDSYGERITRTCVQRCPEEHALFADTHTRQCEPNCTQQDEYIDFQSRMCVDMCPDGVNKTYADPVSHTCVSDCSIYSERFAYEFNRSCVQFCPEEGLYADNWTRRCVQAEQCSNGTWALDPQRECVEVCPSVPDLYGDQTDNTCTDQCPEFYFADPITRTCVRECPVVPLMFGYRFSHICVQQCPNQMFADNISRQCQDDCSTTPYETFADNSTYRCVTDCPTQPDFFASNETFECVYFCPEGLYADNVSRRCVENCPRGDQDGDIYDNETQTFADDSTRDCVKTCPDDTFMQNSTGTCVETCTEGFADNATKYCIEVCPAFSYGLLPERICVELCPENPGAQTYAEDNTTLCQTGCYEEHQTYADDTSNRCVRICPIQFDLYAEPEFRQCVDQCLELPFQFADYSTRTCVERCPDDGPVLFGDLDTQRCVVQCPNDTWADNQTQTCVTYCPDEPLDTYGDNSTWTCVEECPTKPMTYADNSTRTCVQECPGPNLYADNYTRKCVLHCSDGLYADSTTQKCVQTCPQGWFGSNETMTCEQQCQDGQFKDHLLHLCVQKCSVDPIFYGDPDTNDCVEQCTNLTFSFGNPVSQECVKYITSGPNAGRSGCPDYYYAQNVSRLCVRKCPLLEDTYGDNSTWKCVDQCPGGAINTFSDNHTMMCVSICPQYPEYYAEEYSRRCVSLCLAATPTYSGSFADNSTRKCVEECPSDPDYYSDNSTRRCVFFCPRQPLTFADNQTRRCVDVCPNDPDLYGDLKTLRCVQKCPEEQATYADPDPATRRCVKVCPSEPPLYGENQTNRCVPECPNGTYADNSTRLCVAVCPQYPYTFGDPSTNRCVSQCPDEPDLYADTLLQICVERCPDGFYGQIRTRQCLPYCPTDVVNYADNQTNRCVEQCPIIPQEGVVTYGDNTTQRCVQQCPDVPFMSYADNLTHMCLAICQNVTLGGWADNFTRVCVRDCPEGSYGDITTRYCVRYCPNGYFAYPETNLCLETCLYPYYGDQSTWSCVMECPRSHRLFGQNINRTCTIMCPQNTFADAYSQTCVPVCPGQLYDTYGYISNRTCLKQCPYPLFAYPVTWLCIPECINPYYENHTDHRCYKCPDQCEQCNYPQLCITCVDDHFLYSGRCLQSCPTFPVVTYANPNKICGTAFECTAGYFALNKTKSCVRDCPSGFYKNSTLQACDSCLRGCISCTNSSSCLDCNDTISLWDDYKCHIFCSLGRNYYSATGCVSSCPNGTFLQLTTCKACSEICKRCIVQAQNCLTCADGYYLSNNLCVDQCPSNTKAVLENNSLYCKSCSLVDCTVKPLTFEVQQYVQDYEYKFQVQFSEEITIDSNTRLDEIFRFRQISVNRRVIMEQDSSVSEQEETQTIYQTRLSSKIRQRMLQRSFQYMDYTIIDYGNGRYVFVLNDFDTRSNDDMEFSFEITNPQAIRSQSGQFPEQTRAVLVIESGTFYSLKDYNPSMDAYCAVVAGFCVFLLVISFFTHHSIWIPAIDFFHMLYVLLFVNILMPPNPTYCISKAIFPTLSFLPNIFYNTLQNPPEYDKSISSTMYTFFGDMIFVRTQGFLFTVLLVLLVVCLVMLALWKKKVNFARKYCKTFLKETLPKKYLHGFVYLFFLPCFMIGLMKTRNYVAQSAIEGFSIFCSYLFMLGFLAVVIYFCVVVFKLFRHHPDTCQMMRKGYLYITSQQNILDHNAIYTFPHGDSEVDLSNIRQPRINELLILPYTIQSKFSSWDISLTLIQYCFKFMIVLMVVITFENAAAQLILIMLFCIVNFVYFIVFKPYFHIKREQYNNYITLHNLAVYTLILISILVLQIKSSSFQYDERVAMGNVTAGLVMYSMTANAIYFAFRVYNWYFQNVWKPFVYSDLFKDNYTLQYWEYVKEYDQAKDQKKKNSGKRSQFLEAIKLQNKNDGLQNMIEESKVKEGVKKHDKKNVINLRPNQTSQLKKNITKMFQNFNQEKQKSHKSIKSSERLSKNERNRVRDTIFGQKDVQLQKQMYMQMPIKEENEDELYSKQDSEEDGSETEYEYEYIEEEYPEGTDINQILKDCKKGDISMP